MSLAEIESMLQGSCTASILPWSPFLVLLCHQEVVKKTSWLMFTGQIISLHFIFNGLLCGECSLEDSVRQSFSHVRMSIIFLSQTFLSNLLICSHQAPEQSTSSFITAQDYLYIYISEHFRLQQSEQ